MSTVTLPQREVRVLDNVDVCVIGGGPGGLPAALAAARLGAKTLLVEMQGFLGGMATAGLIGPILGHRASGGGDAVIGGIPKEICVRMAEIGEAAPWERAMEEWGIAFNAEGLKIIADRMVREAKVRVIYHAFFVDAVVDDNRMTHAIIETKSGPLAIAARVFIDATGDGDVAYRAGAECTKGRPADGLPMAMGSIFHVGGVGPLDQATREAAVARMRELQADGANYYNVSLGNHGSTIRDGFLSLNATRYGGDASEVADLTEGEFVTRELAWRALDAWRSAPGAEGLFIAATPAHVGTRESRQVVGRYVLTGEDIVSGRSFDDSIARASYWIDIHCPRGLSEGGQVHLCTKSCAKRDCPMITDHADQLPDHDRLHPPEGRWCDVPLRSLLPQSLGGLLVSGRCISADYQAMAATRVMATCMAIGEAAGTAAAFAARHRVEPGELDPTDVRGALSSAGALI
ncbi:MAG: FAD-dependent oxidoreductase [Armatimonadetes bacterium]|jgi:hypothetical protein|nr:FAD-dependent oxidoreductase [Armatimonadota bacterium]MDI9602632.1 FAD-dependent oxidoreductase [Acidobacteriota bacterium]NLN88610.1 FAD-dependent oxidoreductase [candidate division WS1 bacterium]